jgi:hypothetical protein
VSFRRFPAGLFSVKKRMIALVAVMRFVFINLRLISPKSSSHYKLIQAIAQWQSVKLLSGTTPIGTINTINRMLSKIPLCNAIN